MLVALDDGQRLRIQSRRGHRVAHAADALALDVEMRGPHPLRVGHRRTGTAVWPVAPESHRQQPDLAMTELQNMFGEAAHRGAVVDAHPGRAGNVLGLVDHHDRQVSLQHRRQIGVVVGGRVHDEPVDPGGQHRGRPVGDAAVRTDRDQQQALADLLTRFGKPCNEIERRRIAEGVVQRLGDDQTHRAGLAGAQRPGHRIRARIAEPLGGGQHPLAQLGRQLVGPVVGVGDGGARNLELGGQRGQGRAPPRRRTPGHAS